VSEKPLTERQAPSHTTAVDGVFAGMSSEQRLYLHYLAVMCLLGRVCGGTERHASEVERAFRDANELLEQRGSDAYFDRCLPRGYALFERREE